MQIEHLTMQHRMRRQGHGAAAPHGPTDRTFGGHGQPGGLIGQGCQDAFHVVAVAADFNAQGALSGGGQHLGDGKNMANAVGQTQALQARGGQHDARIEAFVKLAQAGVQIAAQGLDLQIGAQSPQQHGAAQTGGAHHGTHW